MEKKGNERNAKSSKKSIPPSHSFVYDFVKGRKKCLVFWPASNEGRPIRSTVYEKKGEERRVRDMVRDLPLPLVLSTRFMEDVLLAVDSKDTVFHDALPIYPAMSVLFLPRENNGRGHTTCF
jgi:hypothetical protein